MAGIAQSLLSALETCSVLPPPDLSLVPALTEDTLFVFIFVSVPLKVAFIFLIKAYLHIYYICKQVNSFLGIGEVAARTSLTKLKSIKF